MVLFGRLLERLGGAATLVAGGEKARLLAGMGVVGCAVDFESVAMHEVFTDTPVSACSLPSRLGGHDRLISCFAAGDGPAGRRLAELCGVADATFLPIRPPADETRHLVDVWAELAGCEPAKPQAAGAKPGAAGAAARGTAAAGGAPSAWEVPAAWRDDATAALREAGADLTAPYAVIHPGSGGRAKCWPLGRFIELARRLQADGRRAVFALGPAEVERWAPTELRAIADDFAVLTCPPLATLAGAAAGASAYVGNDSGVSHLAAAVGCPTVAIFGPTRPEHFAPIGPAVRVLAAVSMADVSVAHALRAVGEAAGGL